MARRTKPYHKRYHGDALQGYRKLSLELRGAYTTLLDVMYDHGGPIEERFACAHLDCDIRVWKRIRHALVDEHCKIKAYTDEKGVAWLVNERAQAELGLPTYAELVANLRHKFPIATGQLSPKSPKNLNENNSHITESRQKAAESLVIPEPDYSVPIGTGAERHAEQEAISPEPPDPPDATKEAWDRGVAVLRRCGLSDRAARTFFGGLLKGGLPAADLLPTIVRAERLQTKDAQAYFRAAADALKRQRAQPERSTPSKWGADEWRAAVETCAETGRWGDTCGPRPGEPGCLAPDAILAEYGFSESATINHFERVA